MADHPISTPEFAALIQEMKLQTDTASAVVLTSRVEDWLEAAIQTKMRDDLSSNLIQKLFRGYGPLSIFAAKIDVAYAFSMFGVETYNDLRAIKAIRNRFAHSKEVIHFLSDDLAPDIQKLTGWTLQSTPIDLFIERCKACVEEFEKHLSTAAMVKALMTIQAQRAADENGSGE
jgi:DNA-binding MltR family transcriptional regulator